MPIRVPLDISGYGGNFDMALAIRTMIIKDDKAYVQAGAGIVYDSDPRKNMKKHKIKQSFNGGSHKMILLIDNYDSFTYNLYQYLGEVEKEIIVKRNDEITIEEIEALNPMAIVISPGPGRPEEAGISMEVIHNFYKKIPILGICLGHQAIGAVFGANVVGAKQIMHGKTSHNSTMTGTGLFARQEHTITGDALSFSSGRKREPFRGTRSDSRLHWMMEKSWL